MERKFVAEAALAAHAGDAERSLKVFREAFQAIVLAIPVEEGAQDDA